MKNNLKKTLNSLTIKTPYKVRAKREEDHTKRMIAKIKKELKENAMDGCSHTETEFRMLKGKWSSLATIGFWSFNLNEVIRALENSGVKVTIIKKRKGNSILSFSW